MALISCPECGHQVSDKARSCPQCGYPFTEIDNVCENNDRYDVVIEMIPNHETLMKTDRLIMNIKKIGLSEVVRLTDNLPCTVVQGVSVENAKAVKKSLTDLGNRVELISSQFSERGGIDDVSISEYYRESNKPVTCPRCGSTAITTGQRGFSIVTGFLGSNKTVNRCGKCGYSWKP